MDYYKTFKPEADAEVGTLVEAFLDLREKLPKILKRRDDEQERIQRLNERLKTLEGSANESLTTDEGSYDKYQTSMRKLNREKDAAASACESLKNDIIPKMKDDLRGIEANLVIKLNAFVKKSVPLADERIKEHTNLIDLRLLACKAERNSFLSAFARIYNDYGLVFNVDESFCPKIRTSEEAKEVPANPSRVKKVIQINAKGKKYFCRTEEEKQIFMENNPDIKTETFNVELPNAVADKYLDDPENKKQFVRRKEG